MALPDPYANEPTAQLNPDKWRLYLEAVSHTEGWQKEAERLQAELLAELGDAHAGTVEGEKVVTNRPTKRYAEARIIKDYPDLTQHYIRLKETKVFDLEAFKLTHPEIADKYQVRSFRRAG